MQSKKIVLLGDCNSAGTNLLVPEIMGEEYTKVDAVETAKIMGKKVSAWYLKNHRTERKQKIEDIYRESFRTKKIIERQMSWPSYLSGCHNLAVMSETFQGMHKKIKTYLQSNEKPDLVLITDFAETHRCVVINSGGNQHVVYRDKNFHLLPQTQWPDDVYAKFLDKINIQEAHGPRYQVRKHTKAYHMLLKFLKHHHIAHKFITFWSYNKHLESDCIDLSAIHTGYLDSDGREIISERLASQRVLADRVSEHI